MGKDLTVSSLDRQNILNNPYAVEEIQRASGIKGFIFENQIWITKSQATLFF